MCGLRRDSTLNMDSAFVFHAYRGVKPRPSLGDTSGAMGRKSLCSTLIPTTLLISGMPRHTLHRRFDGSLSYRHTDKATFGVPGHTLYRRFDGSLSYRHGTKHGRWPHFKMSTFYQHPHGSCSPTWPHNTMPLCSCLTQSNQLFFSL